MKRAQDIVAVFFIICVLLLSAISALGVWDVFGQDVIFKSFQTIGLLAAVSMIVMFASRFFHKGIHASLEAEVAQEATPNHFFIALRKLTVGALIGIASLLGLLGIMAIWEALESDVLFKALSTLGIFAFASFIIVFTCLQREGGQYGKWQGLSDGAIVMAIIVGGIAYLLAAFGRLGF